MNINVNIGDSDMYYKVINKESEVCKKLREQREKEMAADERNKAKIEELLGFKFESFWGNKGFQNLFRVTKYTAFIPEDESKVTKSVRKSEKYKDGYVPNRRSKAGKALSEFLSYGMESFHFRDILEILGCDELYGRFTVPFMELKDDIILLYLDNRNIPVSEDVIEITKKEFDEILNRKKEP